MAEHEKQAVNTAPADVEVGSAEDVEAVMKKYDRESNVRIWTGFPAQLVRYGMALFMLMMIWVSMFSTWEGSVRRCFFLGVVLAFVFIMCPIIFPFTTLSCLWWQLAFISIRSSLKKS